MRSRTTAFGLWTAFVPPFALCLALARPALAQNLSPTLSAIADLTVVEDAPTPAIPFTVHDAETAAASLTVTATSTNPGLVPTNNIAFAILPGGGGSNRTVTVTPLLNQFGSAIINLTVRDEGGATDVKRFILTVAPVNDRPTLDPIRNYFLSGCAPQQIVILTGITSGATNEDQALTVTATSSNPSVVGAPTVTEAGADTPATLAFAPFNLSGTSTLTIRINDGGASNNVTERTFTVTVLADTTAPSISCPSNLTAFAGSGPGATVTFVATAIDDVDPNPSVTCTPSSGSVFPRGTSTVVCRATDVCGHASSCGFTVSVVEADVAATVVSLVERNTNGLVVNWRVPDVPEYDRYGILPQAFVEFHTDNPTPSMSEFQVVFRLVDDRGVAVAILDERQQPGTSYVLADTITLPQPGLRLAQAGGSTLSRVYEAKLKPMVQLDPSAVYGLKVELKKLPPGGTVFLPVGSPVVSAYQPYYHFPALVTPDAAVNVLATLVDATWTRTYLIDTVPGKRDARAQIGFTLQRLDDVTLGVKTDDIVVRLNYELRDGVTAAVIPLEQSSETIVRSMPSYIDTILPKVKHSSVELFSEEISIRPAAGYQLDPVNGSYALKVSIAHVEVAGQAPVPTVGQIAMGPQRLLHFNGTLQFGDIETVVTSVLNDPDAGNLVPNGIRSHLQIGPQGGEVVGHPFHKFGNGSVMDVVLRTSGTAEYHLATAIPVGLYNGPQGPLTDPDAIQRVRFTRQNMTLNTDGGLADFLVVLPTGFGYRFNANGRMLKSVLTMAGVKLNQQLIPAPPADPVAIPPAPASEFFVCEETKPFWVRTSAIRWQVDPGEFTFTPAGAAYVRTSELEVLAAAPALEEPGMRLKRSNEQYFRALNGVGGGLVRVKSDNDTNALMSLTVTFGPGSFTNHFPYGVAVRWHGVGQMRITDDLVVPSASYLEQPEAIPVQYARRCILSGCGNIEPETLALQPGSGRLRFTVDGGMHAAGDLAEPAPLTWGYFVASGPPMIQNFAHQTVNPFGVGQWHMPGCFLRGDQTSLPRRDGPGVLLLTGVVPEDLTTLERPLTFAYGQHDVQGDYAGLNFAVAPAAGSMQGLSFLAARAFGPYQLRSRCKYYVRYWGVSGVHDAEQGSFNPSIPVYDYDCKITNFSLAFRGSENVDSRTEGVIDLPWPSSTNLQFRELTFHCNGALNQAKPPADAPIQTLAYWRGDFIPLAIRFDSDPKLACDPSGGYLAVGVQANVSHIAEPFYGELGFQPNGQLIHPAFAAAHGLAVTSRLTPPAQFKFDLLAETAYRLVPISEVYYNNFADLPTPEGVAAGFLNLAALVDVPFFDDLQCHVQVTAGKADGSLGEIYLMGGWPTDGWQDSAGVNYFSADPSSFDPTNTGYPKASGVTLDSYRSPMAPIGAAPPQYRVQARRNWLKDVSLEFFLGWDVSTRTFRSLPGHQEILFLDMQREVKYLSAANIELTTGAQYQGLPSVSIANLAFDQASGTANPVQDVLGPDLKLGLARMDVLLKDQLHELLAGPLDDLFSKPGPGTTAIDQLYDAIKAKVGDQLGIKDVIALYCTNPDPNQVGSFLKLFKQGFIGSAAPGTASGVLKEIRADLTSASAGVASLNGALNGDRAPVVTLLGQLLGQFSGPEVKLLAEPKIKAGVAKAAPSLDLLAGALVKLRGELDAANQALDFTGSWAEELAGMQAQWNLNQVFENVLTQVNGDIASLVLAAQPDSNNLEQVLPRAQFLKKVRQKIEDRLFGSKAAEQLQVNLRHRLYDLDASIRQNVDGVFQQANSLLRDLTSGALAQVDDSFSKGLDGVETSFAAGKINGYAQIKGDSLKLLRVDLRAQMDFAGKLEFNAYVQIRELDSQGSATACGPSPGQKWTEVTLGADDVELEWLGDLAVQLLAKFTFDSGGLINFTGRLGLTGEMNFEAFKVKEIDFGLGVGGDDSYVAASVRAEVDYHEMAGGFFAGRTCSSTALEIANADFAKAIGPVGQGHTFTGLYLYAEAWFPINELLGITSSCLLNLRGMGGLGIFYNADGPLYGGQYAYGLSGEVLCLVEVQGRIDLVGLKNGDTFTLQGKGTLSGELGICPFCVEFSKSIGLTCWVHADPLHPTETSLDWDWDLF